MSPQPEQPPKPATNGAVKTESAGGSGLGFLGQLGGIVALSLGGLYAYGALERATQIRGADQRVGDVLGLIPLEQLLVAGIGEAMFVGAAMVIVAAIYLVGSKRLENWAKARGKERKPKPAASEGGRAKAFWKWAWRLTIAIFVLGSAFIFSTTSILLLLFVYALITWADDVRGNFRLYLVGMFLIWASITLVVSYLNPEPLPCVTVSTEEGETVEGELLVDSGSALYIGTEPLGFMAVQASDVASAEFRSRDDVEAEESLFQQITGEKFLGLPKDNEDADPPCERSGEP